MTKVFNQVMLRYEKKVCLIHKKIFGTGPGQMSEIVQCSNQFSVRFPNRKSENFGIPKFSVPNGTSTEYRVCRTFRDGKTCQ